MLILQSRCTQKPEHEIILYIQAIKNRSGGFIIDDRSKRERQVTLL